MTYQQIGLAKLRGVAEWLASNVGLAPRKEEGDEEETVPKMIIFAHHIEVLDRIQVIILKWAFLIQRGSFAEKGIVTKGKERAVNSSLVPCLLSSQRWQPSKLRRLFEGRLGNGELAMG